MSEWNLLSSDDTEREWIMLKKASYTRFNFTVYMQYKTEKLL